MKCPKCGSELDTGFNCPNCGYKRYEVAVSKTELTTAEMLLWLAENEIIDIWHTVPPKSNIRTTFVCNSDIDIRHTATGEGIIYVWINGEAIRFEGKTLTEAIIKAYEWARKDEVG